MAINGINIIYVLAIIVAAIAVNSVVLTGILVNLIQIKNRIKNEKSS